MVAGITVLGEILTALAPYKMVIFAEQHKIVQAQYFTQEQESVAHLRVSPVLQLLENQRQAVSLEARPIKYLSESAV